MNSELNELDKNTAKPKRRTFDDDFGIGDGQTDPDAKVVTKKPSLPTNLNDEFGDFAEDTKTTNLRTQPKATASANDMPDFGDIDPPTKSARVPATLNLGIETDSESDDSALTKTTEPIRLKQPVQPTAPANDEFEEPVRVGTTNRPQPKDDFEPVPQRSQRSTRVAQKDMFAEATGFDDPNAQTSPTTNLPPARPATTAQKTTRHPLLREGEYLVEEGDNFCAISKKVYGSEKYYLALGRAQSQPHRRPVPNASRLDHRRSSERGARTTTRGIDPQAEVRCRSQGRKTTRDEESLGRARCHPESFTTTKEHRGFASAKVTLSLESRSSSRPRVPCDPNRQPQSGAFTRPEQSASRPRTAFAERCQPGSGRRCR